MNGNRKVRAFIVGRRLKGRLAELRQVNRGWEEERKQGQDDWCKW